MNNEDAIKYIKDNYPDKQRYEGLCEALDKAIISLEKQIPKKPTHSFIYQCPVCGSTIEDKTKMMHYEYCCHCGQAIDWSNNNE